jgi:protein SCO1
MNRPKAWIGIAVICAAHVALLFTPRAGQAQEPAPRAHTAVPNVELVTHEGKRVRFYDDLVKGKVVLINFMFTNCEAYCPLTTANLVQVQAALGDRVGRDIFLYSITLDPDNDTPEALTRYRREFKAGAGWTFLTGKQDTIEHLRRALGVYDLDPVIDADKAKHSGVLVYGNAATDRWAAMPSLANPEFLARRVLHLAPAATARNVAVSTGESSGRATSEIVSEPAGSHHHHPQSPPGARLSVSLRPE